MPNQPVRILIVDDHPANLLALDGVLDPLGHVVVAAGSGAQALRELEKADFALVLLDVQMRGMDGFETAARMRSLPRSRVTPIIFLSAHGAESEVVQKGYAHGAADYLVKPYEPEIVRAKVRVFVDLFRQAQQIKAQEAALRELERAATGATFRRIMDTNLMGLMFTDSAGAVTDANEAFLQMLGYSRDELTRGEIDWKRITPPEHQPQSARALEDLATSGTTGQYEKDYLRKDGTRLSALVAAVRVEQLDRNVSYVIDISARKRTESHMTLLAKAGELLTASLDYEETLKQVAALCIGTLADWCAVDLLQKDQVLKRVAIAHRDASRVSIAEEVDRRYPPDPAAPQGVYQVMRTQRHELMEHLTDEMLLGGTRDPEHLAMMRALQLRSYLIVPLVARSQVLGALTLVTDDTSPRLSGKDVHIAVELARRAALAIDNARLFREASQLVTALSRSNAELDQFAYVASHDLKAPLRGIANLSQWIEEDLADSMTDETREQMKLLRGRVHRLEGLIDGILRYSRAGRVKEKVELVDTGKLVAELYELLAPPPTVSFTASAPMPVFQTERMPLQQVFQNLMGNALKYGRRDDLAISVAAEPEGAFWHFSVTDNGPGISPEYHERIWGIFQTLEARDRVEGTGIGLSVVRKYVEAQGGKAWVESRLGEGASFHFTWPR